MTASAASQATLQASPSRPNRVLARRETKQIALWMSYPLSNQSYPAPETFHECVLTFVFALLVYDTAAAYTKRTASNSGYCIGTIECYRWVSGSPTHKEPERLLVRPPVCLGY